MSQTSSQNTGRPAAPPPYTPELSERGAGGSSSDRRLFMRLLAFTGCRDTQAIAEHLAHYPLQTVVYEDAHDPLGIAVLTISEDPSQFVGEARSAMRSGPMANLTPRPQFTMFGRTYTLGYERDLDDTLLHRPVRTAMNPDWPWAVWYPLRRKGTFEALPEEEKMAILREHGTIGMGFGAIDAGHDIRLACHGLDTNDNDFVVALVGPQLSPLSKLVQTMRRTQQTSLYLERLGPFFVGRAAWRSQTVASD